jgi:glycosyltransferase involved in cell wall biosynthesis
VQLLKALQGDHALYLLSGKDGPLRSEIRHLVKDIAVVAIPKLTRQPKSVFPFMLSFWNAFWGLYHMKKKWPLDLVYVNTLMFPQVVVAAFLNRLTTIVHLREMAITYPRPAYLAYLLVASFLSREIVVVCRYASTQAEIPLWLSRRLRGLVLYNTSDYDVGPIKREVGSHLKVLIVIPLTERKGALEIAEFARTLRTQLPHTISYTIDVVGPIPDRNLLLKVRSQLAHHGLLRNVTFHGQQSEMANYYANAHLVIHPSHAEAFSRVIVEAANYSLPCIATDVGGTSEGIEQEVSGYVVPVGDTTSMARCAVALASDAALYCRMSANAYHRYETHFSLTSQATKIRNLLQRLQEHARS